jgi:predicted protein tyrosine phosphatase
MDDDGGGCGCAARRPSWRPGLLAAGAAHDAACAALAAPAERRMVCPTCACAFPYAARGEAGLDASGFLAHVNGCDAPAAAPAAAHAALAHLFRVRAHARIAAVGPPARTGAGWPAPDAALAASTPSTRAIVVRDGPWYTLAAGDADEVPLGGGAGGGGGGPRARLFLGSEAAARAPSWLAAARVAALVNCAHNSEPLPPAALAAAGVAAPVRRVRLVDAEAVAGQDAGAMIDAGADEVARALDDAAAAGAAEEAAAARALDDAAGAGAGGAAPRAVLVHCVAGISRSASCVIAYLVKHGGLPLADAAARVRAARPAAMPNADFWRALGALEARARGGARSVSDAAVDALHPRAAYPISTHIFGQAARS